MGIMKKLNIKPVSTLLEEELIQKINSKTKPIGALGKLEKIALQIGKIQQTAVPKLTKPNLLVFAGDHGIAATGLVNPYPQEVTYQMVLNFLNGGAAVNVFAKQNKLSLKIVDAGVNYDFNDIEGLVNAKIAFGTENYLVGKAMTNSQCNLSIEKGCKIIQNVFDSGCNIVGFGEMGIGNTSSAALIMSTICDISIEKCVGKGTGVNVEQLKTKIETLKTVEEVHKSIHCDEPLDILCTFGGFEIAQMCGGMLKAAELGMVILVDGFISTSALLIAHMFNKNVLEYCIFTHHSYEQGHKAMLEFLKAEPLMNLEMRLGEGSGIAVAYPIIESAISFLNEMASFDNAGVTNKG